MCSSFTSTVEQINMKKIQVSWGYCSSQIVWRHTVLCWYNCKFSIPGKFWSWKVHNWAITIRQPLWNGLWVYLKALNVICLYVCVCVCILCVRVCNLWFPDVQNTWSINTSKLLVKWINDINVSIELKPLWGIAKWVGTHVQQTVNK